MSKHSTSSPAVIALFSFARITQELDAGECVECNFSITLGGISILKTFFDTEIHFVGLAVPIVEWPGKKSDMTRLWSLSSSSAEQNCRKSCPYSYIDLLMILQGARRTHKKEGFRVFLDFSKRLLRCSSDVRLQCKLKSEMPSWPSYLLFHLPLSRACFHWRSLTNAVSVVLILIRTTV